MLTFLGTKKGITLSFEEDEALRLCPHCGMPNKIENGYCADCGRLLQTPKNGHDIKASEIIKCPECGRYNIVGAVACATKICGYRFEKDEPADDILPMQNPVYIKVCPQCQHENPAVVDNCEHCGADITLVIETEKGPRHTLFNLVTHQIVLLCHTERQTIGREHFLQEQVASCDFVGRAHADIFCRDGQWFIRDRSRNGTYLKGKRIEPEVDVAIEPGVVISLGDPSPEQPLAAHFRFDCHAD